MKNNNSFFSQLWERRIFQIVGSYLIGAWAFVQFVDWVVERYQLTSGWTEFVIIFLFALLPSVVMLTWYHGRPGPDAWRKIEKIFIPINVIFAGLLAFVSFPTQSNAAQIQEIVVPTEEGDTIVRNVPTLEFQERIVIFQSKTTQLDADDKWLGDALPALMDRKLEQDMRFTVVGSNSIKDEIVDYGFSDQVEIPMNIYRSVAEDAYANHYLLTEIIGTAEDLELNYSIHESKTGKEKKSGKINGNVYEVADMLHDEVRNSIFLTDFVGLNDYINLGAKSLITPNISALKAFTTGINLLTENSGSQEGFGLLLESANIDSTCSECYAKSAQFGLTQRGIGFKKERIEKALLYYKALPERQQLDIKYWKYFPEDFPKMYELCNMWMTLYPMDSKPYRKAMDLKTKQLHWDEAIKIGEKALDNGHAGSMYLSLARLYTLKGNLEKSNEYLKKFAVDYPQKAKTVSEIGLAYLYEGETKKGLDFFKSKVLLDAEKPENHMELASAYSVAGDIQNMLASYKEALNVSKSVEDSISVLQMNEIMLGLLGRFSDFEIFFEIRKKLIGKIAPPMSADIQDIYPHIISIYKDVNQESRIKNRLSMFIEKYNSPAYDFDCALHLNYFIGTNEGDSLSYYLNRCREKIAQTDGAEVILLAEGVAALAQGNYESAVEHLEGYCKATGLPSYNLAGWIGKAYFLNGDLKKAEELFLKSLSLGTLDPGNLHLLAQVQKAQGNIKKAKESAEKAFNLWKEADPEFVPKQELEAFRATLLN